MKKGMFYTKGNSYISYWPMLWIPPYSVSVNRGSVNFGGSIYPKRYHNEPTYDYGYPYNKYHDMTPIAKHAYPYSLLRGASPPPSAYSTYSRKLSPYYDSPYSRDPSPHFDRYNDFTHDYYDPYYDPYYYPYHTDPYYSPYRFSKHYDPLSLSHYCSDSLPYGNLTARRAIASAKLDRTESIDSLVNAGDSLKYLNKCSSNNESLAYLTYKHYVPLELRLDHRFDRPSYRRPIYTHRYGL